MTNWAFPWEKDIFRFFNYHSNMSMFSAPVLSGNTSCGIGQFFAELVQLFIRWLAFDRCHFILVKSFFNIVSDSHGLNA
jgi:hypothetical protein